MKIQTIPFIKIAIATLLGVSLSIFLSPTISIILLGSFAFICHFHNLLKNFSAYFMLAILSFVLGYISFHHNPFYKLNQQTYEWKGVVIEKGQKFSKGMKYIIQVLSLDNQEKEVSVNGKVMLMIKNEESLQKGEIINFKGKCNMISYQDTSFWDRLNYKNGLHATVWSYQVQKKGEISPFYFALGKVQNYFDEKIHTYIPETQSAALATGILLGDKSYMDKETKNEFIDSGAAHILAVSGLHVSILTLFLNFLLGIFFQKKIKFPLIITILLFYALITGLSPAVVRAVLMACLAIIAKMFNRNYIIVNILAFSFTLQLLMDPFLIFHLGFWLSYLAILGIVFIQPHLIMPTKNKISKWLQDNITVGISAQIATLPVLLGFLGKFPVLFIVTNLITLPLSIVATYCGFLLLFVAEIPFLNEIVGFFANRLFSWVLTSNQWIASIPYSSLQFSPSFWGLVLSLIALIIIIWKLNYKSQNSYSHSA